MTPHSAEASSLLIQELRSPRSPQARSAVLAATLRGVDPILHEIPWEDVSDVDAMRAGMRIGPLSEMESEQEVRVLLGLENDPASIVAATLARYLSVTSTTREILRSRASTFQRIAARNDFQPLTGLMNSTQRN